MRDAIGRFDDAVRRVGDPEAPSSPVTLRAACSYLFRRAVPALVPVVAAVLGQLLFSNFAGGALLVAGVGTAMAGGVAGAALALERPLGALLAAVASAALLVAPAFAVAGGVGDLFGVQTGLFGVVTLFVAAICYVEAAGLDRGAEADGAAARSE